MSHAASQFWSCKIEGISTSAISENGKNVLVGSSSGTYYLFNEFAEIVNQEDIGSKISSVDMNEESMILGTESATFILSIQGRKILHNASDPVLSVAISESNSYAISGTEKNIYRFDTLKNIRWFYVGMSVKCVAISPNGRKAAAATSDAVYLFDNDTEVPDIHRIPSTTSMQFLEDESLIVGTKTGSLYSVVGASREVIEELGEAIVSVETGNDRILASTSKNIYLFDSEGKELADFTVEDIVDCDMSLDGKFIVAASSKRVYLFNERGEALLQRDVDHIASTEISSNGKYMTVTTSNGILFFCNWEKTFKGTNYYPYASREHYSFEEFKRVWSYPVYPVESPYIKQQPMRFAVGDVNGDGKNEIVVTTGGKLVVLDSENRILAEKSTPGNVYHVALLDTNNDTVPEIFYSSDDGGYDIFVLGFVNGKLEELNSFDFTEDLGTSYKEKREAAIIPVISYDIDDDENVEIIAVVNSGYTLKPRGILAFEYSTNRMEWFYESAVSLAIEAFYDIDQDGKPEIILDSHSTCNGNTVKGRDDCHACLVVLNVKGEEVWSKEITQGTRVIRAGVDDIDKDGRIEIVGTVLDANSMYGRLFVTDNKGRILYDEDDLDHSLSLGGIVDFDGDGCKEIVVTDSNGNISIYSHELRLLRTHQIASYQLSEVEGISDMDGDGDREIILRVWDRRTLILSGNLEEEWSKAFESITVPTVLATNVSGCGNDLLVLTEKALELYSFEKEGECLCVRFVPGSTETPTIPPTTSLPSAFSSILTLAILVSIAGSLFSFYSLSVINA